MSMSGPMSRSGSRSMASKLTAPWVGQASFNPLSLSPALWLDSSSGIYSDAGTTPAATDGTIQQWNDKSGNTRHATQTTGTKQFLKKVVNSRTVLRSDGSDDVMRTSAFSLPQPCTIYAVAAPVAGGLRFFDANTVNGAILMSLGTASDELSRGLFAGASVAPTVYGSTVPDVYVACFDGASSFLESGLRAKTTGNPGSAGWSDGVCLGGAGNEASGFCWGGDWYHLMAFSGTHTLAMRNQLRAFFASRFAGIPLLRFTGDSLTQGTGATIGTNDYPTQTVNLLGASSYEKSNGGIGGSTAQDWSGTSGAAMAGNAGQYSSALRKSVNIHWAGTNDILAGTRTAAQIYQDLKDSWAVVRASGMKVVAATIIARQNFDATQETRRSDLNTLIRSDTSLYDALMDVAALSQFDQQSDTSNTTYYDDGVHLTPTGYGLVAGLAVTAINTCLALPLVSLSSS